LDHAVIFWAKSRSLSDGGVIWRLSIKCVGQGRLCLEPRALFIFPFYQLLCNASRIVWQHVCGEFSLG